MLGKLEDYESRRSTCVLMSCRYAPPFFPELFVGTALDDFSVFHHENHVSFTDRAREHQPNEIATRPAGALQPRLGIQTGSGHAVAHRRSAVQLHPEHREQRPQRTVEMANSRLSTRRCGLRPVKRRQDGPSASSSTTPPAARAETARVLDAHPESRQRRVRRRSCAARAQRRPRPFLLPRVRKNPLDQRRLLDARDHLEPPAAARTAKAARSYPCRPASRFLRTRARGSSTPLTEI